MKTIDDNEMIETSRGRKRIGALFDENAMLRATNADLLAALKSLLAYDADGADQPLPGTREAEVIATARAAIEKAEGQS